MTDRLSGNPHPPHGQSHEAAEAPHRGLPVRPHPADEGRERPPSGWSPTAWKARGKR
jgi:hypothetical protein